jgi:dolichol-phosphate mannosyltransferase
MLRQIPVFKKRVFNKKQTKYCLCMPVINEGERLLKQLERIKQQQIDQIIDIVICDGDSSDGSTEEDLLKKYGINTLLIKKDVGKLSAQLRMGYAWALERGYAGVITMDGNNKDNPADIVTFINKLEEGYDLVQGSRFIKGGKEINTPIIRKWAIKLIHAPIISLKAGFKFTDTTNGFRGYSVKYLEHPEVQPLRTIFMNYELLAYLSVRASRLGLKTVEIPVERGYPKGKKVPSKISFWQGNLELLKTLMELVFNRYDP